MAHCIAANPTSTKKTLLSGTYNTAQKEVKKRYLGLWTNPTSHSYIEITAQWIDVTSNSKLTTLVDFRRDGNHQAVWAKKQTSFLIKGVLLVTTPRVWWLLLK
jgi:hypothetical protein